MGEFKELLKKRSPVNYWSASACLLCHQAGRSFLRRMIDLSKVVRELQHKVRLNAGFHSDIRWWGCFLPIWNGTCQISSLIKVNPSITLTSDASRSWGCGAFTTGGHWFQLQLLGSWQGVHITVKELLPIVLGSGRAS